VRDAVTRLRLVPVLFELGARPHPPRNVYRSYLAQSQVFLGIYWQSYGWVAPGEQVSGLEDEYDLSAGLPRLIYVKGPAPDREPLGVFAGSFSLPAAEAIGTKSPEEGQAEGAGQVMDTLGALVDSSLVRPQAGSDLVAGSKDMPPHQQAMALIQAGSAFAANGDLARGRQLAEQSLALYKQDNERLALSATMNALVLAALGHLAGLRHDYAGTGKLLDQGQALLREFRDDDLAGYDRLQYRLARVLADNFLGQVRLSQDNNDAAAQLFTDGLAMARRAQDWISLLVSLYDLAFARQAQGDLAGAAGHLTEGLALAAEARDDTSAAYYLEVLAAVAGQQDNPQRATRLFAAARSILDARGSGWLHAFVPRFPHDDEVLAALRSQMGDAAFEKAQAWGRSAGISHFEYGVLALLSEAPGRTLRMSELAMAAGSSLPRLSQGQAKVTQAAAGHVQEVRRLVFDPLTKTQSRQLREIGRRITRTIDRRLGRRAWLSRYAGRGLRETSAVGRTALSLVATYSPSESLGEVRGERSVPGRRRNNLHRQSRPCSRRC